MKYTLTFEIKSWVNPHALFDVVSELGDLKIQPECLVWSMVSEGGEARLWMNAELTGERLETMAAHFQSRSFISRTIIQPRESDPPRIVIADTPAAVDGTENQGRRTEP